LGINPEGRSTAMLTILLIVLVLLLLLGGGFGYSRRGRRGV
jgi:flagellar basal body-associated protein FliL